MNDGKINWKLFRNKLEPMSKPNTLIDKKSQVMSERESDWKFNIINFDITDHINKQNMLLNDLPNNFE